MRKPSLWTGVLGAAIALTMVARPAFAVQETKIGVTSASNFTTTGFPPVSPEHLLKIGVEVVGNERVITTKDGRAQLLFLDHSALTVGPNSNLVLDKFVYDPDAGIGELVFSATKGIFRLVGGRISKKTPVTIKTPSGTIGIRGGIAIVSIEEGGPVEAIFLFGKDMTVCSGGTASACVTATRPGSAVTIDTEGNVSAPVLLSSEQISGAVQQLEQTPGQTSDTAVLVFQQEVKDAVLGALAEPAAGPIGTTPPPFLPLTPEPCPDCKEDFSEELSAPAPAPIPLFSGRVKRAVTANSLTGTNDGNPGFNISFAGATADIAGGVFDATLSPTQQLTLNFQPGEFAATSTTQPFGATLDGTGFLTADQEFVFYQLTDQGDGRDVLVWAGVPTPASAFPTSGATFYEFEPDFVLRSNVPFLNSSTPFIIGGQPVVSAGGLTVLDPVGAIIDWDLGLFGGAAIVIDGAGTNQQSAASVFFGPLSDLGDPQFVDIDGRIRGSSFISATGTTVFIQSTSDFRLSRDGDGNGFFGSTNPDYFVLEADSAVIERGVGEIELTQFGFETPYNPNVIALATPGVLGPRTDRTLNGFAGGLSRRFNGTNVIGNFMFINTIEDGSGITIQTDAATGTLTAVFDVQEIDATGNDNRLVASFGGADRSAFFDDESFGAFESTTLAQFTTVNVDQTNLYMVTSEAFQSSNFPGAASECACQFLEWGFWGGEITFDNGDIERIHLATWIAGENIASGIDLPTVGIATYNGHLIGTVLDNGDVYQAMGDFGMTFDFADPLNSTINVNSFDGVAYNAEVGNLANGIYFADGQDASALGRDIFFEGAFFGGGGDAVAETGGNFNIDGPSYTASGIFAGAK